MKKEIAARRAQKVSEPEQDGRRRSGGASVAEAAQKLGRRRDDHAVDRSGTRRMAGWSPASRGLDASFAGRAAMSVSTTIRSVQWRPCLVTCSASHPHEHPLVEVRAQVEAKWREDQFQTACRPGNQKCKSSASGNLAEQAARSLVRQRTSSAMLRLPACLPAVTAAFRTVKDGVGRTRARRRQMDRVRVTDVTVPPVDMASDEVKKLKETLDRGLADEQVAQFVNKIEKTIGTTINQAAFAQATGASSGN